MWWCVQPVVERPRLHQQRRKRPAPPSTPSPAVSGDIDNAALRKLQEVQRADAMLEASFVQSSQAVDCSTFADVRQFPVNSVGQIHWPNETESQRLRQEIKDFLRMDDQIYNSGRACHVWSAVLSLVFPWMEQWALEDKLFALVVRGWHHRKAGRASLDYIEFFCGQGNLSREAISANLKGVSLDVALAADHDALQPEGLELMLLALAATKPQALVWHGTPCSSFTVMCRSVSKRCSHNEFGLLGDQSRPFVQIGNALADVSALTFFLAHLLNCIATLEQPASSVMLCTPSLHGVLKFTASHRIQTYHGCFGGSTMKPLQLASTSDMILDLRRSRPSPSCFSPDFQLAKRSADGQGFTGDKSRLEESQVYSRQFGKAVIQAVLRRWRP